MAHERAPAQAQDVEAEAIARLPLRLEPVHAVHLAQRAALEELRAARGPVAELQHREPREVGDAGRRQRGRGRDAAQVARGRFGARGVRQPARVRAGQPRVAREAVDRAVAHAERAEDALANVPRPRQPDTAATTSPAMTKARFEYFQRVSVGSTHAWVATASRTASTVGKSLSIQ